MLGWQHAPQQLPFRVRPVRGETVASYARRLATANELARPTILLRAIGKPRIGIPHASEMFDVRLNQHSLHRLEVFTGIPAQRLTLALPSLATLTATPATIPAIHPFRLQGLRPPCHTCAARIPDRADIQTYPMPFPRICARHNRWIDSNHQEKTSQFDLTHTPELVTAHRRYSRLREQAWAQSRDPEWVRQQMWAATWVIVGWADRNHLTTTTTRVFHDRLAARLQASNLPNTPGHRRLLVFPEAVALAELFCDLDWRRHVAMVDEFGLDMNTFVRAVARRLGQPPSFTRRLSYTDADPLRAWIRQHRHRYTTIRNQFYDDLRRSPSYMRTKPFPEIRHFT